jgi:hypothetical protein
MHWIKLPVIIGAAVALCMAGLAHSQAQAQPVTLAAQGRAQWPVVIAADASPAERAGATELAQMLGQITGATFELRTDARPLDGIVVGTAGRLPHLSPDAALTPDDPTRRESYRLRSHAAGLQIIAASDMAVAHAVWDLLHRLGYRLYFPGPRWEIVPRRDTLTIDIDVLEQPSFYQRHIWNGGGYFDYDKAEHEIWLRRNRVSQGLRVASSHIYDAIVLSQPRTFEQHPEYLALIKGQRVGVQKEGNKFCISNADLRSLCVQWAKDYLAKRPQLDGVSMEPSDGGGWCECDSCAAMGSVTDRAILLANQVARAINTDPARPRYVGMLAYGYHSPPPQIEVDPHVIVSVAAGFIRGNYTFEELLKQWGQRCSMIGTYDYLGVVQWSWCRPGVGRATRIDHMQARIPQMYAAGVRLYTGEAEGSWGPAGLGMYLCSRVLWDIDEKDRIDQAVQTFLDDCFGAASPTMAEFYRMIDGSRRPLLGRDLVGRMYRLLDAARRIEPDPAVQARLADLVIYTRYVELYLDYQQAQGEARQAAFELVMRYVWRVRKHFMVHAREIYRQLGRVDNRIKQPAEVHYRKPEGEDPWKSSEPVTEPEVSRWVVQGIASNPLHGIDVVTYEPDLVPAAPLRLPKVEPGTLGPTQNRQEFYVWAEQDQAQIVLEITGGLIRHYRDRGDVRIALMRGGDEDEEMALAEARVAPDGQTRAVTLVAAQQGLYRITLTDGGDRSQVAWPAGVPISLWSDLASTIDYSSPWTLWFYVPRGTTVVGGYSSHPSGLLVGPDGKERHDFSKDQGAGYFKILVPRGEDGRLWQFRNCVGRRLLMTVPPVLARSERELLLPREVVRRDAESNP